jgi:hypothetical protein
MTAISAAEAAETAFYGAAGSNFLYSQDRSAQPAITSLNAADSLATATVPAPAAAAAAAAVAGAYLLRGVKASADLGSEGTAGPAVIMTAAAAAAAEVLQPAVLVQCKKCQESSRGSRRRLKLRGQEEAAKSKVSTVCAKTETA